MNIPKLIQELQGHKLVIADLLMRKAQKLREIEDIEKKIIEESAIIETLEVIIRTGGFANTPEKGVEDAK